MYIPFENMPDNSRVWVYQSPRVLSEKDKEIISGILHQFTSDWQAHQQPLQASFTIVEDHYVILAVNEAYNNASGCSIDTSVRIMQQMANQLNIDFFNRAKIGFQINGRVELIDLPQLSGKLADGIWNTDTPVYNTTVSTIAELKDRWLVKAGDTWLSRYLKRQTA